MENRSHGAHMNELTREERIAQHIEAERKSVAAALILAFFFGPIGFLYTSLVGGVIMTSAALGLTVISPTIPGVIWLVCIFAAPFGVADHNKLLRAKAEEMAG